MWKWKVEKRVVKTAAVEMPETKLAAKMESVRLPSTLEVLGIKTEQTPKESEKIMPVPSPAPVEKVKLKPGLTLTCLGAKPDVTHFEDCDDEFFYYNGELCIQTQGGVYTVEEGEEVDIEDDSVVHPINIEIKYEFR